MGITIRPIMIAGNIASITLTKGRVAMIDAADVPLVEGWNWTAQISGQNAYAIRGERRPNGGHGTIRLHRVIMGDCSGCEIDHINGNGLDNRRANLRVASHGENMRNRRINTNNSSGYKGVCWCERSSQWLAQIRISGRRRHLGYFPTKEAAGEAYAKAAAELHGDFVRR